MNFDLSTSTSPWYQAPITPSNTVDFDTPTQGIYVGGGGDVSVVRHDGTAVLFTGVPAGSVLPVVARRVGVSGTSASGLVGLWGVELGPAWSGSGFSPLDLSPVLWLDASDTSTITEVGGAVSQWDDKSGNGYNVTQGTAANQPTSGTRTLNSLNVIDFDGSDLLVKTTSPTLSQPNVMLLVAQLDGTPAVNQTITDGTTSTGRHIVRATSTGEWMLNSGSTVTGGTTDTSPHVFRALFDGASSSLHVDGSSVLAGDAGSQSLVGFAFGGVYTVASHLDGIIAEIIVVDGTLTAGEIADTEQYLANKWGITLP